MYPSSQSILSNNGSSLKSFTVLQKLGEGSFASVYKVMRNDDQKLYAMKKVKIGQMKQRERDNALNQVRILASISHSNIVNYKQAFFDDLTQSLCIVMELADDGDIQKKINLHLKNHSHFTQAQIWQALIQMTRGLKALHQINILHRDLKCANVFCTKDNKYKLGDLNVSKVAKRGMARTQTGTPYYTSPQVWKDRPYDSKCDIWSLGCVVYEMASLYPPFRASNLKQLYAKIQRGIYQRIPAFYSQDLYQIINCCLKVNPSNRLSAPQILQHSKVIKNTPISQKYAMDINQTKKTNLINTILCPRNLKSLKSALPGANYEQSPRNKSRTKSVQIPQRRVSSAKSLSKPNQIPRVINSPKVGEIKQGQIKYAFMRRPSSDRHILPNIYKKQANSEARQRQYSGRQLSQNNSRLARNNSVDSLRKKQDSSRVIDPLKKNSNQSNVQKHSSQKRVADRSVQRAEKGKQFMQDISNRCKNIEQRVNALMGRRKQVRVQKVSQSYEKRYNLPQQQQQQYSNSRQKREYSGRNRNLSRNNSIQVKPISGNNANIQKNIIKPNYGMIRNKSIERMERNDSRKKMFGVPPKN